MVLDLAIDYTHKFDLLEHVNESLSFLNPFTEQ